MKKIKYTVLALMEAAFLLQGVMCIFAVILWPVTDIDNILIYVAIPAGIYFVYTFLGLLFRWKTAWYLLFYYLYVLSFGDRWGFYKYTLDYLEDNNIDDEFFNK